MFFRGVMYSRERFFIFNPKVDYINLEFSTWANFQKHLDELPILPAHNATKSLFAVVRVLEISYQEHGMCERNANQTIGDGICTYAGGMGRGILGHFTGLK